MQNSRNETFQKAPVEYMRLFVHVQTSEALRSTSMAGFAQKWLNKYPEIEEHPPLPETLSTSEFQFLDDDNYWPMPFTLLSSPENGCGIMFQSDRIGVFWERTPNAVDRAKYPGFDNMKRTLLEALTDFTDQAHRDNISVTPVSVECLYENKLQNMTPSQCMLGRMTNWSNVSVASEINMDESSYFDVHDHNNGADHLPVWISLRPAEGEQATNMMIRSSIVAQDDDNPTTETVTQLLDTSHSTAKDQYTYWVPPTIRNSSEGGA